MVNDEFQELFVDESEVIDKVVLKNLLLSYVKLTKEGSFLPEDAFHKLDNTQKVAIFLLSRKVIAIKGFIAEESVGPKDIAAGSGIPEGSVKSTLFNQDNKLFKNTNGKYWIPNYNIGKVRQLFGGKSK
jgi:hypothetical protein